MYSMGIEPVLKKKKNTFRLGLHFFLQLGYVYNNDLCTSQQFSNSGFQGQAHFVDWRYKVLVLFWNRECLKFISGIQDAMSHIAASGIISMRTSLTD